MKSRMLVLLGVALVAMLPASAAQAWPGGRSVILFDGDGFEVECLDIDHDANTVMLFWTDRATTFEMVQNVDDPARCEVAFRLPNDSFGGLYDARNTYLDCTCSRRGTPRYQVQGFPAGSGSCACTATYMGMKHGNVTRTESLLGVELGGEARCKKAYAKPVLRPRLIDRWNAEEPTR